MNTPSILTNLHCHLCNKLLRSQTRDEKIYVFCGTFLYKDNGLNFYGVGNTEEEAYKNILIQKDPIHALVSL